MREETAEAVTYVFLAATLFKHGKCKASGGGVKGSGLIGDVISANSLFPGLEPQPGVEGRESGGMDVMGHGPRAPYQWNVNFSSEQEKERR